MNIDFEEWMNGVAEGVKNGYQRFRTPDGWSCDPNEFEMLRKSGWFVSVHHVDGIANEELTRAFGIQMWKVLPRYVTIHADGSESYVDYGSNSFVI